MLLVGSGFTQSHGVHINLIRTVNTCRSFRLRWGILICRWEFGQGRLIGSKHSRIKEDAPKSAMLSCGGCQKILKSTANRISTITIKSVDGKYLTWNYSKSLKFVRSVSLTITSNDRSLLNLCYYWMWIISILFVFSSLNCWRIFFI